MTAPFRAAGRRLRLAKFSLVGGIGIGVQLAVLAVLTAMSMNYLLATALAVESAVLHNFLWHQRFTWPDRTGQGTLRSLLRFHLSNGSISLLGNLLLMRRLVGSLRWPIMGANAITITLCWAANYLASDRWVFPEPTHSRIKPRSGKKIKPRARAVGKGVEDAPAPEERKKYISVAPLGLGCRSTNDPRLTPWASFLRSFGAGRCDISTSAPVRRG